MSQKHNSSNKFRAALKNEIPIFIEDGIITSDGAEKLKTTYELDNIEKDGYPLVSSVFFTMGALLISGGVISFVASHWDEISKWWRVALLITLQLTIYFAGYWFEYKRDKPRLGAALTFCGALIFGANIALLAQIFQISGKEYRFYGAWAIGSLLIAWAAESRIIGLLYLLTSFIWFGEYNEKNNELIVSFYPLALAITLLPLARRLNSSVLYTFTFIGMFTSLTTLAAGQLSASRYALGVLAIGGLFTWSSGEFYVILNQFKDIADTLRKLGVAILGVSAYIGSFHWVSENPPDHGSNKFYWVIPIMVLGVIWIYRFIKLWPKIDQDRKKFAGYVLSALAFIYLALLLEPFSRVLPVIAFNIAALIVAGIFIFKGIIEESRFSFWSGTLYVALLIFSRFFEFDSSLLLKSIAFVLCGIITMIAGNIYEHRIREKGAIAS